MTPKEQKSLQRQTLLKQRLSMDSDSIHIKSQKIVENLHTVLTSLRPEQIFSYASHKKEPNLEALQDLMPTTLFAYPRISPTGKQMEFFEASLKRSDEWITNHLGILEPQAGSRHARPPTAETVVLLPAVAISRSGVRLGFGGGFYDRFLSERNVLKRIGIVFHELLLDFIAAEPHDVLVEVICTDEEIMFVP